MKPLDFIIIGAQKAATTSLFRYLSEHGDIEMPLAKEAPFYSDDKLYSEGWGSFVSREFPKASDSALWGTASPQYMSDERVPERIASHAPKVKLIAILRNPIDRAYSHYEMAVRRGIESRSFSHVVDELTCPQDFVVSQEAQVTDHQFGYSKESSESSLYLSWSEYGRILSRYHAFFPNEQLKIVFMDQLESDPVKCVSEILDFLNLDKYSVPGNVGKIYHRGGRKTVIPESLKLGIKRLPFFLSLWHLLPDRTRGALNYWYEQANVKRNSVSLLTVKDRERLTRFFEPDVALLKKIVDQNIPWAEFA